MSVKKTCSKCQIEKSISQFYKQKNGALGRTAACKDCRKKCSQIWANENREQKNQQARSVKRDRKEYSEKWRNENPNYFKEYYKQNTELRLEANRRFLLKNPERKKFYSEYSSAKSKGLLLNPGQCQMCGTKDLKVEGHHFDYTKPLSVTWVCTDCHKGIHRRKKFTEHKS
ncbi:MAG: hypothetical protein Q8876_05700 [Bacillota bacterium]|nr:hypothetical protein [Bacillota bacterium]